MPVTGCWQELCKSLRTISEGLKQKHQSQVSHDQMRYFPGFMWIHAGLITLHQQSGMKADKSRFRL